MTLAIDQPCSLSWMSTNRGQGRSEFCPSFSYCKLVCVCSWASFTFLFSYLHLSPLVYVSFCLLIYSMCVPVSPQYLFACVCPLVPSVKASELFEQLSLWILLFPVFPPFLNLGSPYLSIISYTSSPTNHIFALCFPSCVSRFFPAHWQNPVLFLVLIPLEIGKAMERWGDKWLGLTKTDLIC